MSFSGVGRRDLEGRPRSAPEWAIWVPGSGPPRAPTPLTDLPAEDDGDREASLGTYRVRASESRNRSMAAITRLVTVLAGGVRGGWMRVGRRDGLGRAVAAPHPRAVEAVGVALQQGEQGAHPLLHVGACREAQHLEEGVEHQAVRVRRLEILDQLLHQRLLMDPVPNGCSSCRWSSTSAFISWLFGYSPLGSRPRDPAGGRVRGRGRLDRAPAPRLLPPGSRVAPQRAGLRLLRGGCKWSLSRAPSRWAVGSLGCPTPDARDYPRITLLTNCSSVIQSKKGDGGGAVCAAHETRCDPRQRRSACQQVHRIGGDSTGESRMRVDDRLQVCSG